MARDLARGGFLRRLARLGKERRRARRPRSRASRPAPTLADVLRAAAREGAARALDVLRTHRHRDLPPRRALEAIPAIVLLRAAAGHFDRSVSAVDYAERVHVAPDLERALRRARRRLRPLEAAGCESLSLARAADWTSFATAVRSLVPPRPPPPPPPPVSPPATRRRARPVVLHATGGLGNQLFQAAAATALSRRLGARVLLDARDYERADAPRALHLPRFRVDLPRAGLLAVARALGRPHVQPGGRRDDAFFDRDVEWLRGYFEDPVYFRGVEDDLRTLFRPRDEALEASARAFVDDRRRTGPVAGVHVRRGDRVGGRAASGPHRAPPLEFARRAIAALPADARVVLFSDGPDDVAFVRDRLALGERLAGTAPALDPVFDLVALSACDHVVVSGSTFSWWAAWLGDRPGRAVLVPEPKTAYGPWYADALARFPVLPAWTVVPVPPRDLATIEGDP